MTAEMSADKGLGVFHVGAARLCSFELAGERLLV